MPIKKNVEQPQSGVVTESTKSVIIETIPERNRSSNDYKGRLITLTIIIVIWFLLTFIQFLKLNNENKLLKDMYQALSQKAEWDVYTVNYEWGSSTDNNLKWIWEKSLWFPSFLKGKECYILGSKISWDDWWTIRWFLWKNYDWNTYRFADSYEASVNNLEGKIEITKWNWSSQMLTKKERDNLYFSLRLLCSTKNTSIFDRF